MNNHSYLGPILVTNNLTSMFLNCGRNYAKAQRILETNTNLVLKSLLSLLKTVLGQKVNLRGDGIKERHFSDKTIKNVWRFT